MTNKVKDKKTNMKKKVKKTKGEAKKGTQIIMYTNRFGYRPDGTFDSGEDETLDSFDPFASWGENPRMDRWVLMRGPHYGSYDDALKRENGSTFLYTNKRAAYDLVGTGELQLEGERGMIIKFNYVNEKMLVVNEDGKIIEKISSMGKADPSSTCEIYIKNTETGEESVYKGRMKIKTMEGKIRSFTFKFPDFDPRNIKWVQSYFPKGSVMSY